MPKRSSGLRIKKAAISRRVFRTIDLHTVHISSQARKLAAETLAKGWISAGALAHRFEEEFARTFATVNPVSLNSGTSALHLALVAAGIGPGDEVIVPPQTFIATALAPLMVGAVPVFADIDFMTGNISPKAIEKGVTSRTKAIICVHYGGYPCDMEEITVIARRHGLVVIEDAAQALGAEYRGRPVGAISPMTVFSFQATKHLTTGDGGMLCCRDAKYFVRAKRLRWFGIDRDKDKVSELGERMYTLTEVGYKYHMNDLTAAIGVGNLVDIRKRIVRRQKIAWRYYQELSGIPGLELLENKADRKGSYWLFTVHVQSRNEFIRAMRGRGIPASVIHQRIDRHPLLGGVTPGEFPNEDKFNETQAAIPVHDALTDGEVRRVIRAVQAGW